jgi:N-acetylneuraminic acid mutarotase
MIIWGGSGGAGELRNGARYDPVLNSWSTLNLSGSPSNRTDYTVVWTGSEMIVWGGQLSPGGSKTNTGARYSPATNTWSAMSTSGAPTARIWHSAVWTGSEMIIWGGYDTANTINTGAKYNPVSNTWSSITASGAPSAESHKAIWTGQKMIIWGGYTSGGSLVPFTGALYDATSNIWSTLSTVNAPSSRESYTINWTGDRMVIWGGYKATINKFLGDGAVYDPAANTWDAVITVNGPGERSNASSVWTGSSLLIWGGFSDEFGSYGVGATYNYQNGIWNDLPSSSFLHLYQKL